MKIISVLTGSGISAESGLDTFRDSGGLWENHRVEDVATLEAFERNPEFVLKFYNERRRKLASIIPNAAHVALARLQEAYTVHLITQNIDDLHERAGSKHVLHLHGELTKARSSGNSAAIIDIGYNDIELGQKCKDGFQLRPHVVWFGEPVDLFSHAQNLVEQSSMLIVVGTSLSVYPAASLLRCVSPGTKIIVINKEVIHNDAIVENTHCIEEVATTAVPRVVDSLMQAIMP